MRYLLLSLTLLACQPSAPQPEARPGEARPDPFASRVLVRLEQAPPIGPVPAHLWTLSLDATPEESPEEHEDPTILPADPAGLKEDRPIYTAALLDAAQRPAPPEAQPHAQRAERAFRAFKLTTAITEDEAALALHPAATESHWRLARAYALSRQNDRALFHLASLALLRDDAGLPDAAERLQQSRTLVDFEQLHADPRFRTLCHFVPIRVSSPSHDHPFLPALRQALAAASWPFTLDISPSDTLRDTGEIIPPDPDPLTRQVTDALTLLLQDLDSPYLWRATPPNHPHAHPDAILIRLPDPKTDAHPDPELDPDLDPNSTGDLPWPPDDDLPPLDAADELPPFPDGAPELPDPGLDAPPLDRAEALGRILDGPAAPPAPPPRPTPATENPLTPHLDRWLTATTQSATGPRHERLVFRSTGFFSWESRAQNGDLLSRSGRWTWTTGLDLHYTEREEKVGPDGLPAIRVEEDLTRRLTTRPIENGLHIEGVNFQ